MHVDFFLETGPASFSLHLCAEDTCLRQDRNRCAYVDTGGNRQYNRLQYTEQQYHASVQIRTSPLRVCVWPHSIHNGPLPRERERKTKCTSISFSKLGQLHSLFIFMRKIPAWAKTGIGVHMWTLAATGNTTDFSILSSSIMPASKYAPVHCVYVCGHIAFTMDPYQESEKGNEMHIDFFLETGPASFSLHLYAKDTCLGQDRNRCAYVDVWVGDECGVSL
ncbi:hypothetical protein BJV82DRAFT_594339 [Fennellomyces sp. T-0311]|nr:hypothetical protein BJV82DRAFT_594339 [Fennellomyces sp. T-0311]